MNIVLLRTNGCRPDPRVEKEVNSLLTLPDHRIKGICWDRDGRRGTFLENLEVDNGRVPIIRFGVPASWGGGMRENFFPMLRFEWKLFRWLMVHYREYDTIHACDLLTGLPAWLPCRLFHKKMVYDIFDYYAATQHGPEKLLSIFRKLENGIINCADVTILCSEKRREQISGSRPRKLVVLHNAPGSSQILNCGNSTFTAQGNPERTRIVYVGNLVDDRFVMKALACAKNLPEVEFHIGGFGVLEDQIRKMAEKHENIFFYGRLAYQDVLALERQCHIVLALYDPAVPNHAYAAPNKFYEALALGKPLVMFHNTGMDAVVEQQDIGIVCEATEAGLQEAFRTLIARKAEWQRMSAVMQRLYQLEYSWDIMGQRLCQLYKDI